MDERLRRATWWALALLLVAVPASAQRQVTATSRLLWTASADHDTTYGTPPQALLTSYRLSVWAASNMAGTVPLGPPAATVDVGKGTPDANRDLSAPLPAAGLSPGVSYYVFVSSIGPGNGETRSEPLGPFVLAVQPPPPPACGSGLTVAVTGYSRTVAPGGRGRVDFSVLGSAAVTLVQVKLGTQVVGEIKGAELRDIGAVAFSVPRQAGDYQLTLTARDAQACETSTTAVRTVTVP